LWKPKFEPLVEMADYIKVDFCILSGPSERKKLLRQLSDYAVALIAEKVETQHGV
jgi:c-di-GMP-related signal transduction protein